MQKASVQTGYQVSLRLSALVYLLTTIIGYIRPIFIVKYAINNQSKTTIKRDG
jgi:hypothetical protein